MAAWSDLPAEIKQMILEYLLSQVKVKFSGQFVTTRLAAKRSKEQDTTTNCNVLDDKISPKTDTVSALLSVSKKFLTYAEIEIALLHYATITSRDSQTLHKIEKRFTSTGLAAIKELYIVKDHDDWRCSSIDVLPSAATLKKMQNLRRVTFFLKTSWFYSSVPPQDPLQDLLRVADGYELDDDMDTIYCRRYLESLLECFLSIVGERMRKHLVRWLTAKTDKSSTIEHVLTWKISLPSGRDPYIRENKTTVSFSGPNDV